MEDSKRGRRCCLDDCRYQRGARSYYRTEHIFHHSFPTGTFRGNFIFLFPINVETSTTRRGSINDVFEHVLLRTFFDIKAGAILPNNFPLIAVG